MTFTEWILTRRRSYSERGDFVADCKMLIRSGKFPEITRASQLDHLVQLRGGCLEARREGRRVWRQYQREQMDSCAERPKIAAARRRDQVIRSLPQQNATASL
jgi:hypothetical protein